MNSAIVTFAWWAIGYGFAFGDDKTVGTRNQFIGNADFMLVGDDSLYHNFVFQWTFASASASSTFVVQFWIDTFFAVVSGAVCERLTMTAYFLYSLL